MDVALRGPMIWTGARAKRRAISKGAASVALALICFTGASASACPRCAAGQQARRELLAAGLPRQLGLTALPFLIVGAIGSLVEGVGRQRSPRATHRECSDRPSYGRGAPGRKP
jgi:hypothetical protein